MYVLLVGYPPYKGNDTHSILDSVVARNRGDL